MIYFRKDFVANVNDDGRTVQLMESLQNYSLRADTDVFPVVAFRVEKRDNCINVRLTELLIIIIIIIIIIITIIIIIILSSFLLDCKTVGFFSKSVKKSVKRGANLRSGSIFVSL